MSRRVNRRWTSALALALVACATVAQSASSSNQQSVTLTMSMTSTYQPGFVTLINRFERAFPNIDVEATYYVAGDPYSTAVATRFAAGNGTDLLWSTGGRTNPTAVWAFGPQGHLADLNREPFVKRLFDGTKKQYVWGNRVRAWDLGLSALALLSYNKTYFQQNNLRVPTTFAQLLQLCRTIASQGKVPIAWAGASQAVNSNNVVSLGGNTVLSNDPNWLNKRINKRTTYVATPGWKRALQQVVDMKSANCFGPGVEAVSLPQMLAQFASGTATMMFTYAGLNGQVLAQAPSLRVGMFVPPADRPANTRLTVQAAGGVAIWSKSRNQAAARTFVNFISREAQSRRFAKINFLISPLDAKRGKLPTAYADLRPWFTAKGKVVSTITAEWPNLQMTTLAGASIQGLFTGQKNVDQVLRDLDQYIDIR